PVALPEAGPVVGGELDPAEPLRALPEVLAGDDEAQRPAVLERERLAVGVRREQRVVVLERRERDVRGEALLGVGDREARARARAAQGRELAPVDALEARVEAAPARDAVDVLRRRRPRQLAEPLPRELELALDLAEDPQRPRREVDRRNGARVEHRP